MNFSLGVHQNLSPRVTIKLDDHDVFSDELFTAVFRRGGDFEPCIISIYVYITRAVHSIVGDFKRPNARRGEKQPPDGISNSRGPVFRSRRAPLLCRSDAAVSCSAGTHETK